MTIDYSQVAFVDTETLGLDPFRHSIWEIAIIVDGVEHTWQNWVSLEEIAAAEPVALEISRFAERYDRATTSHPATSAARVEALLAGRHIVGAVPSFDELRLSLLCDRAARGGLPPDRRPWHYHLIDVEALAVGYLNGRQAQHVAHEGALAAPFAPVDLPWKSHDLSERIGVSVPIEDEHTALGDARWAKAVYEAVMS